MRKCIYCYHRSEWHGHTICEKARYWTEGNIVDMDNEDYSDVCGCYEASVDEGDG